MVRVVLQYRPARARRSSVEAEEELAVNEVGLAS